MRRLSPAEEIEAHQRRLDAQVAEPIPDDIPLTEIADMVVRGKLKLSPQRQRMLIELLPYTAPKLAVQANVSSNDLGKLLDARLDKLAKKAQGPLMIEDLRGRR
jgi:hypothetical protein